MDLLLNFLDRAIRPSPNEVSALAYLIYEREGRPEGMADRHWLEAEQQLLVQRFAEWSDSVGARVGVFFTQVDLTEDGLTRPILAERFWNPPSKEHYEKLRESKYSTCRTLRASAWRRTQSEGSQADGG